MVDRPPYQDYLPKQEPDQDRAQYGTPLRPAIPAQLGHSNHHQQPHYNNQPHQPYHSAYSSTQQHVADYQNSKFNASTYASPSSSTEQHSFPPINSNQHPILPPVRPPPDYSNRINNPPFDGRASWRPSLGDEQGGASRYRAEGLVSPDPSLVSRSPASAQFSQSIHQNPRFDSPTQYGYHQDGPSASYGPPSASGANYYFQNGPQHYNNHNNHPQHPQSATYSPAQQHHSSYAYPSPLTGSIRPSTGSDYHPAVATPNRAGSFVNSPLAHQQAFPPNAQDDPHPIYAYPGSGSGPTPAHAVPLPSGSSSGSLTRPPTRANSISDPTPTNPSVATLAYTNPISQLSRQNSPTPRQFLPSGAAQAGLPPLSSVVSPLIPQPAIPVVHAASSARRVFRSRPPPLTFNPAREPSASARLSKTLTSQGLVVPAQGSKGKAVLEIVGSCWTCGEPSCKVILRGQDLSFSPRLTFTCLACVPEADRSESPEAEGGKRAGSKRAKTDEKEAVYSDTLSAAVDVIEGVDIRRKEEETPEATCSRLPETLKPQGMKCDVCDRIVGCGTIAPADPHAGPAPPFTSEVICARCTERYRACSDCGGGGGRLTPGRWRCKELFPQGRRTCQLSHARNPPLNEITYHVLPIVSLGGEVLEDLKANCRQLYFNTRLRVTARPEMLERGDGLCRTFAEAEKLTIDGWNLLQPLMEVDIEREKGIRRYVAVQYSIPHRRRAKSKNEPPPEEVTERTVSGFMLVEYDFVTGSVYFAVVMPWALSGDAFDATTRLGDEVMNQCRADLALVNEDRARQGIAPYPPLSWNWGITPFKKESRMTQSLTRRGFVFLDELIASGEMPESDLAMFPGYGKREIHVPNECKLPRLSTECLPREN